MHSALHQVAVTRPDLAVGIAGSFDGVSVLLNRTNRVPTATGDAYTTSEDTTLNVAAPGVLGNDNEPDGDALTARLTSQASHGSVLMSSEGSFAYVPDANYNGPGTFTYTASEGSLAATATPVRST